MLSERESHEKLVKSRLVIKENKIRSLLFFLKSSDPSAILQCAISSEEYTERMSYDSVSRSYPFFIFLLLSHI